MRLPRYLKLESIEEGDDPLTVRVTMRIRWWHPSWWLAVIRETWREVRNG